MAFFLGMTHFQMTFRFPLSYAVTPLNFYESHFILQIPQLH